MRLDKFLANNSSLSRKQVKQAIKQGMVTVNDSDDVRAEQILTDDDVVLFNNVPVRAVGLRYLALNKPQGYVCADKDKRHSTVFELIFERQVDKIHTAGRLDLDTTGLILMSDDGQWLHRVTSPKYQHDKVYQVIAEKPVSDTQLKQLEEGVFLEEDQLKTQPALTQRISETDFHLTLREGKYHQVKRMLHAIDNEVIRLHRISVGTITLDGIDEGDYRELTADEIDSFSQKVNRGT